ncbi:hypothetical protein SK128_001914, partial [Halocaridina rubra]
AVSATKQLTYGPTMAHPPPPGGYLSTATKRRHITQLSHRGNIPSRGQGPQAKLAAG